MFQIEGNHLLCIDCHLKFQQALAIQNEQLSSTLNWLTDQMESRIGLSGVLPRIHVPKPVHIHNSGKTNFNNIRIEGSVVGSINTGEVERIDLALTNVRAGGQDALASELQKITQAVLDSKELAQEARNEAVEGLSYLAEQAVLPQDRRQKSLGKRILSNIERLLTDSANLTAIYMGAAPILHKLFS